MPQAKKKTATKTAKKTTKKCARSKASRRTYCQVSKAERNHIYLITAMSIIAAVLLCANIAIMTV